jgi:hypothetical protein
MKFSFDPGKMQMGKYSLILGSSSRNQRRKYSKEWNLNENSGFLPIKPPF